MSEEIAGRVSIVTTDGRVGEKVSQVVVGLSIVCSAGGKRNSRSGYSLCKQSINQVNLQKPNQ